MAKLSRSTSSRCFEATSSVLPSPAASASASASIKGLSRDELFAALKADYQQRMEDLTHDLAPRFQSGELRGWNEDDELQLDEELASRRGVSPNPFHVPPIELLEEECRHRLAPTLRDVFLTLACSSYTGAIYDDIATHPVSHANLAAARDVLRAALHYGLYHPSASKSERPSAEWLALHADEPLPDIEAIEA